MRAEVRKDGLTTKIYDKVAAVEDRGGAYEIKFWDKPSAYVFKNAADSVNVVLE